EAERVHDLVGEHVADVLTGGGRNDLPGQRSPRQRVVDVHHSRWVDGPQVSEHFTGVFAVVHPLQVGLGTGSEGNARAVGQHVPDGGAVLAVAGVGRQVLADPVVE